MGRLKVFLRSFCLSACVHEPNNHDPTYNQGIDVSHLATPHITASNNKSSQEKPLSNCVGEESVHKNTLIYSIPDRQTNTPSSCAASTNHRLSPIDCASSLSARGTEDNPIPNGIGVRPQSATSSNQNVIQHDAIESHPPPSPDSSVNNLEQQQDELRRSPNRSSLDLSSMHSVPQQDRNQLNHSHAFQDQNMQNAQASATHNQSSTSQQPSSPSSTQTTAAKLSYDIISVREPLAKLLAERQQQIQLQQQNRHLVGDHEYIEVYGERGSSCFYEEIAGSVTSSATYDQIGTVSNHNYQALINAYATSDAQNNNREAVGGLPLSRNEEVRRSNDEHDQEDHTYDVTEPQDQPDGSSSTVRESQECPQNENESQDRYQSQQKAAQSIPLYSVINKANRRSNSKIHNPIANLISDRPPQPPPKNLNNHRASADNNDFYQQNPNSLGASVPSPPQRWSQRDPIPSTSSYATESNVLSQQIYCMDSIDQNDSLPSIPLLRKPHPHPRLARHRIAFSATDRPLPSPDSLETAKDSELGSNSKEKLVVDNHSRSPVETFAEEDRESLDNGYELLKTNLEDDQIDIGYEKIREANRYSGGSLSSQFCPLQLIDNGGYESVQPIYSSPSLTEPNYEAIAPITASELAAAATAKLTAAAAVIEQAKTNSQLRSTMI